MALNIPLPDLPGTGFLKGVDTGSSMFSRLMHPVIQRENMARQWKQHLDSLALQKAAAGRASQAASDAHKLAMMKLDPDTQINLLKRMMAAFGEGGPPKQESAEESYMPSIEKFFGGQPEQYTPQPEAMESQIAGMPQSPSISYAPESFIPGVYDPIAGTSEQKEQPLKSFVQSAMPGLNSQYPALEGMFKQGNINLNNRPSVKNADGGTSTIYSMGVGLDNGREALIPRVSDDGRILSEREAIDQFKKTGKHLGIYNSREEADKAAQQLHEQQAQQYGLQDEQIPELNPQAISPREAAASGKGNGIDMEAIKKSPILRGWFKKNYGIDPGAPTAQTPEEKTLESIKLHQQNRLFDIEHPTNKEAALSGPARDAASLAKLKKDAGENSEVYQNAKAQYDAQIDAKKDLRDIRARTKAGLKPGEKEFFDPQTGAPLGKEIPLTAKEREAEEGNILFNEFFPYVYKGGSPFSGEGSIGRLEQAAAHYKTDPKAAQLFDDLLLSDKMLAATTVNEASTLKAGRTNRTYGMLKESLESQDIPKLIKKLIKEYKIPASAQLKASMRYQEILSNGRKKARKGTPATQKLYYDPELQAKNEAEKEEGNIAPTQTNGQYNDTDMVKVQGPNGIEIMTYAEAKKLGAQ